MSDLKVSQRSERSILAAFVLLCFALLAISFAPILIRFSEVELSANATVFNRLLIFFMVFGSFQVLRAGVGPSAPVLPAPPTQQQWLMLGGVGVISVFSLGLWAVSLEYTSVAKSMLLNNLTPVFTTLGGWLFFSKQFDKRFLVGMSIALIGAIALGFEDLNGAEGGLLGDGYALLSAVFLGAYFLVVEQLRERFTATTILLWRCGVGSAVLLLVLWLAGEQMIPTTQSTWLAVIGLGILCEGFGQRLLADSMDRLSSSFISVFLLLEPIISALLAWVIFVEHLSPVTWVGFAVVLTGIYLAQTSASATTEGAGVPEMVTSKPE